VPCSFCASIGQGRAVLLYQQQRNLNGVFPVLAKRKGNLKTLREGADGDGDNDMFAGLRSLQGGGPVKGQVVKALRDFSNRKAVSFGKRNWPGLHICKEAFDPPGVRNDQNAAKVYCQMTLKGNGLVPRGRKMLSARSERLSLSLDPRRAGSDSITKVSVPHWHGCDVVSAASGGPETIHDGHGAIGWPRRRGSSLYLPQPFDGLGIGSQVFHRSLLIGGLQTKALSLTECSRRRRNCPKGVFPDIGYRWNE